MTENKEPRRWGIKPIKQEMEQVLATGFVGSIPAMHNGDRGVFTTFSMGIRDNAESDIEWANVAVSGANMDIKKGVAVQVIGGFWRRRYTGNDGQSKYENRISAESVTVIPEEVDNSEDDN